MAELRDFLSELATDPKKLSAFVQDPDAAMKAAELSDDDVSALRSKFPAMIHARLAGIPAERAFIIEQPGGFALFWPPPPPPLQIWPPPPPLQVWPPPPPPLQIWPPPPPLQVWPPPPLQVWPPPPPPLAFGQTMFQGR